jgi:hypothetical protein
MWNTVILEFFPDGTTAYRAGSWRTTTTRERLNHFGRPGIYIRQAKGVWWISDGSKTVPFVDDLRVGPRGKLRARANAEKNRAACRRQQRLRARIRAYARTFIARLYAGQIPAPSEGDCWFCLMSTADGKTLGDSSHSHDHLRSHLAEKYYVPSLLYRALTEHAAPLHRSLVGQFWAGSPPAAALAEPLRHDLERCLARYLLRRLT